MKARQAKKIATSIKTNIAINKLKYYYDDKWEEHLSPQYLKAFFSFDKRNRRIAKYRKPTLDKQWYEDNFPEYGMPY